MLIDALGLSYYFSTSTLNETWWYISLAFFLIFLIPILVRWYKKDGILIVVVGFFTTYWAVSKSVLDVYGFTIVLGIWCAEENVIEKIGEFSLGRARNIFNTLKILLAIVIFWILMYTRMKLGFAHWVDALMAMDLCCLVHMLNKQISVPNKLMAVLGKHSMNIFLIHTIIFKYYFTDFVYGFSNWILIMIAIITSSLMVSAIIESLKKLLGFNKLFA